jgi:hypothetical protein
MGPLLAEPIILLAAGALVVLLGSRSWCYSWTLCMADKARYRY